MNKTQTNNEKQMTALETSLYWQEYVETTSRNPRQRERCQRAADKLRAAIQMNEANLA
jgi:hypothetical protein